MFGWRVLDGRTYFSLIIKYISKYRLRRPKPFSPNSSKSNSQAYPKQCCQISAMADIGGGFLAFCHVANFVKDGDTTTSYIGHGGAICHPVWQVFSSLPSTTLSLWFAYKKKTHVYLLLFKRVLDYLIRLCNYICQCYISSMHW